MRKQSRHQLRGIIYSLALLFPATLLVGGCMSLGPDFVKPEVAEEDDWLVQNKEISTESPDQTAWWKIFNDPVLDVLVEKAYEQNLPLQIAGLRIFEARAQLGIAVGLQYPQTQTVGGGASAERFSENSPNFNPQAERTFRNYQTGFDAAWELDFWGRFRRGIESADANLSVTVADYDNALVSLTAEVARVYVNIRTLEERLRIAFANIELQKKSLHIATVRFRNGATTELDVSQARTNLADTQAQVPVLTKLLRQAKNALSILLGVPPSDLTGILGEPGTIPVAPEQLAAGIPAELLRRRPDVHQSEMLAASQSALIGVAETDLYPSFSLFGSIGFQTSDTGNSSANDLFDSDSLAYSVGPAFSWKILNYGRLRNNVRVQDARYQQAIVNYQNTVLTAYQEVEDAMVGFIQSRNESYIRAEGTYAAKRSVEISNIQYREGSVDFQRVLDSERALVFQEGQWTQARGDIALNLVAMYKALGGGWELREGLDFISDENRKAMEERTNWGKLLDSESQQEDARAR
jgi:NodT family efflux transporter outer membrane factor (OMF) lipoprotein